MAEENVTTENTDTSVAGASAAIEALLKANPNATRDPSDMDDNEIQPEAPAPQAQASEANDSEEVQAPAAEVPATTPPETTKVQPEPATKPDASLQEVERAKLEATTARDQFLTALNTLVPQLEAAVKGEFADIKTHEDLLRVGQEDPDRYNRFVLSMQRLNQAQQVQQQTQSQVANEQREKFEAWQKGEKAKLDKLIPELTDPQKGPELAKRIQTFALENGYTAQQLVSASAQDFAMLRNAMEFASLEKAKAIAQTKAAKAPPVQTPGASRTTDKDEKVRTEFERLQKTGNIHDAASVMRNFL